MKIVITMTPREVDQALELAKIANADMPDLSNDQEVEVTSKAFSGNLTVTKANGLNMVVGMESFFIEYILRKAKPFITGIMGIIEMIKDLGEDIKIIAGNTTTKINGSIVSPGGYLADMDKETIAGESEEE